MNRTEKLAHFISLWNSLTISHFQKEVISLYLGHRLLISIQVTLGAHSIATCVVFLLASWVRISPESTYFWKQVDGKSGTPSLDVSA